MKKSFLYSALAATMLLTTACQDDALLNNNQGDNALVTINLTTPQIATRAYSDGTTAQNLQYAVYAEDGTLLNDLTVTDATINMKTKVDLQLTTGNKYRLVFWALSTDAPYTIDFAGKKMTVDYTNDVVTNNEDRDAFYRDTVIVVDGNKSVDIDLYRPFAQLNIGTDDLAKTEAAGYKVTKAAVATQAYSVFNFDGTVEGLVDVAFTEDVLPQGEVFPVKGYDYVAMNYLLMSKDKEVVDKVTLTYTDGTTAKTRTFTAIPLQRNYRTNIYGQLFTSDVDVNVEIIPVYEEPQYAIFDAFQNGGTVTLRSDIEVNNPLVVNAGPGKDVVLDLNGHSIFSNGELNVSGVTSAVISVKDGSHLTIVGDGKVSSDIAYAVSVRNGGVLDIYGGTYSGYCTAVYGREGLINIYGGEYFVSQSTYDNTNYEGDYEINCHDQAEAKIYVYGGRYNDFDPANNYDTPRGLVIVPEGYSSKEVETNVWEVSYTAVEVANATDLQAAIDAATEPTVIVLTKNVEAANPLKVVAGKDITLMGKDISVYFQGHIMTTGKLAVKNMTVKSPAATVPGMVSQFSKTSLALQNQGKVVCENVTFEMGQLADATAITAWWSTGDGANITVKDCVFNCAGQRPMRSDACVTVENCTFNDPYRYAVQMTSKSSTMDPAAPAYVNFKNNTIVAGTTSTKPVYGVQLEGGYGCKDLTINGAGNTINLNNTGKFAAMYFCECGNVDHATIVWNTEVDPIHESEMATVSNDAEMATAIGNGATTIVLGAGSYIIPDEAKGKTLTIIGAGADVTKIATQDDGSYEGCDYSLDGSTVTFKNISINTDSHTYTGYARCNGTYENCTINGTYTLYGNSVFTDCTFNVSGDVYNIWTWGAPTAVFTGCTFNSDGKAMLLYGTVNTKLTMNNCTFNDKGGLTDKKAAIEIGNDYDKFYELIVNNATVNGYEINDKGINTGTTLWANKNSMPKEKLNVVVDGVDVY